MNRIQNQNRMTPESLAIPGRGFSGLRFSVSASVIGALLLGMIVMMPAAAEAETGQDGGHTVRIPPKVSQVGSAASIATTPNPARLKSVLLSIHGYKRSTLEAVTTDVAGVLRQLIVDAGESNTVRRQAVRALRFYPTEENLVFIKEQLSVAKPGMRRLFTTNLGAYKAAGPLRDRVAEILSGLLLDDDVGVRFVAIGAIKKAQLIDPLRETLKSVLGEEENHRVQRALKELLRN